MRRKWFITRLVGAICVAPADNWFSQHHPERATGSISAEV
jgi:hypothetical protein